jgi:hypothetical protein
MSLKLVANLKFFADIIPINVNLGKDVITGTVENDIARAPCKYLCKFSGKIRNGAIGIIRDLEGR